MSHIIVVYLDISKASDTVSYNTLVDKLVKHNLDKRIKGTENHLN